ncbi:hypothetical protein OO013_09735 [Mangrovivirga sp. M17]|uniref:Membrane dipeptidase (Peptidase family M19) n=1 Tax=Mangrovivirga halotolerans TaxID=2993936 RepID=A0ABT3RRF2_9BACT|nr:hypothetical protein [Mangrovivirga halotolerans]MCX2744147.1 hypothetical protein [Mangrovivirga halotolerans]
MADIFDFHFHPLGKQFLSNYDVEELKNDHYSNPVTLPPLGATLNDLLSRILNSQASVSQARQAGVKLGIANIITPEYVFASEKGVLKLLELDLFGKDVIAPLDSRIFDFIRKNRNYNFLFEREVGFYGWASTYPDKKSSKIKILTRKEGAQDNLKMEEGRLNLILAIEGGHNLLNEALDVVFPTNSLSEKIKEYRDKGHNYDYLYVTLTHLSHVPRVSLCSHAFGFKLVAANKVNEAVPVLNGLTRKGKETIRELMDCSNNEYPILIDIKHMSLKSRFDFYKERSNLLNDSAFKAVKKGNKKWWPIIATHMGITGYRYSEMTELFGEIGFERGLESSVRIRFERQRKMKVPVGWGVDHVCFNPMTINLCDDDIEEIAKSNGLIGISLDARILGHENFKKRNNSIDEYDYMSKDDFVRLFPEQAKKIIPLNEIPVEVETEEGFLGFAVRKERELYLFCFTLLHVARVIDQLTDKERNNKSGWEFLTIGSDFDGLIDSIKEAETATDLPSFRKEVKKALAKAEKSYVEAYDLPDGFEIIPRKSGKLQTDQVIDMVFGQNGINFVKEWWGVS